MSITLQVSFIPGPSGRNLGRNDIIIGPQDYLCALLGELFVGENYGTAILQSGYAE
jgi:hypothetical protein